MKRFIILVTILQLSIVLRAKEGMWIPIFLEGVIMNDMNLNGFKLTADEIYSINTSSLKDAVVRFGGGCTAEVISNEGLLLTNHHCGYGAIQTHSSVEHDYLTDGFWARQRNEELKNPGLTAMFIVRIEDVTEMVLALTDQNEGEEADGGKRTQNIKTIIEQATRDTHYEGFVKSFFEGRQYLLFITETFKDVRLVGAPPSSIGKFGFDTDNWVWPRHTGDFSVFRIYADKDNNPAEYNALNVPYHPKYHLPISLKGYKEGDFSMVYGFPYKTEEYLSSFAVDQIMHITTPARIEIRTKKLEVLNRLMSEDDVVRIKYAAKQSSVSNAWKKWRGQISGLKRINAVDKKRAFETSLKNKMKFNEDAFFRYKGMLDKLEESYRELNEIALARDYFTEIGYAGTDAVRLAYMLDPYVKKIELRQKLTDKEMEKINQVLSAHFKNYDKKTDQMIFDAIFPIYVNCPDNFYKPKVLKEVAGKYKGKFKEWSSKLFEKTLLADEKKMISMMTLEPEKGLKNISKDRLYLFAMELLQFYRNEIEPAYKALDKQIEELNKLYFEAMQQVEQNENYYPDANGTLRVSYGKVAGMHPMDAVEYNYFTTLDGVIEKYDSSSYEFNLPQKLLQLQQDKVYDEYGEGDQLKVCFIASNHTSGGNSGSPVLNANGELIGLNFDRNWEGTMSDLMYDANLCRNISVDIRYVLFIIDRFAEAHHLIEEMTIRN